MKHNRLSLLGSGLMLLGIGGITQGVAAPDPDYTLHEWGTFTSVFGSGGRMLSGLEREEEHLPGFVHALSGMRRDVALNMGVNMGPNVRFKGWMRPLSGVTVKMETPVIYFYSDEPFSAKVDVGFRGGSISQWYPQRTGGETMPAYDHENPNAAAVDFAKTYNGSISWDIDVLERNAENDSKVFVGTETPTWLYPRMTDANVVRTANGEHEKYLFYRGVGNFGQAIRPEFTDDRHVTIANTGDEAIPYAMLFYNGPGEVRVQEIDGIPAQGEVKLNIEKGKIESGETKPIPNPFLEGGVLDSGRQHWEESVYDKMVAALVAHGLYQREADAMVRTWWRSYFEHEGLRLFWIVPDRTVENVLPLRVEPAPKESKRVLVGRSELLTPKFERKLLSMGEKFDQRYGMDRFYRAYSERLRELTKLTAVPKLLKP